MKKHIILAGSLIAAAISFQSCLDFDNPGDELGLGSIQLTPENGNDTVPEGGGEANDFNTIVSMETIADKLDYQREFTQE